MGQPCQSKPETFLFSFFESKVPAHPAVFELQAKTWHNVLDIDDDDADWLLGGAKAEPTNWRDRNSLKARAASTSASPKICLVRHQDGPHPWYEPGSFSLDLGKPTGPLIGLAAGPWT